MPSNIKKAVNSAIKELAKQKIMGAIYYYKRKECSCCYHAENVTFQIQGNKPGNYLGEHDEFKLTFNAETKEDKENSFKIYFMIKQFLSTTNYEIDWNGTENTAMFIREKKASETTNE